MGMTLQIVGLDTGTEGETFWARITGVNSRGRVPVKFRGQIATALVKRISATLGEGETISSKRLFIDVEGGWENFVNGEGKNIRYFKPTIFEIPQGPSLELARMRSEATAVIQNAETLRKAGCLAQAYKMITEFTAELAQLPLDLSEMIENDNDLIGAVGEEDHNPEAAAAAHYLREERLEQAEVAAEQADTSTTSPEPIDVDIDEIVLSNDEVVEEVPEGPALDGDVSDDQSEETLEAIRTGARIEAALAASEQEEEAAAEDDIELDASDATDPEVENDQESEVAQDNEVEQEQPARAPTRRIFGRR